MRAISKGLAVVLAAALTVVIGAAPAAAAAPPNDTEGGAIEVTDVPFTQSIDTSDANADGPRFCSNSASVFYRFTPAEDAFVQVDTMGSDYDTVLGIYSRNDAGAVAGTRCNDDRFGLTSGLRLHARAGVTYFFMVGQCCGNGYTGGGALTITVTPVVSTPLDVTGQITDPVTVDPDTGLATLSGTVTCSKRSAFYPYGVLRQLRQGMFVARGSYGIAVPCSPGAPSSWSVEIDTETSVAFGPGPALVRTRDAASDGWREFIDLGQIDRTVQIVSS